MGNETCDVPLPEFATGPLSLLGHVSVNVISCLPLCPLSPTASGNLEDDATKLAQSASNHRQETEASFRGCSTTLQGGENTPGTAEFRVSSLRVLRCDASPIGTGLVILARLSCLALSPIHRHHHPHCGVHQRLLLLPQHTHHYGSSHL